jgi:hypothetical protein
MWLCPQGNRILHFQTTKINNHDIYDIPERYKCPRLRDFVRYSYIVSLSNDPRENLVNGLASVSNRQQRDQLKEISKQLDRVSLCVYPLFSINKNLMKEPMREIEHRITASERGEDYKGEC